MAISPLFLLHLKQAKALWKIDLMKFNSFKSHILYHILKRYGCSESTLHNLKESLPQYTNLHFIDHRSFILHPIKDFRKLILRYSLHLKEFSILVIIQLQSLFKINAIKSPQAINCLGRSAIAPSSCPYDDIFGFIR